MEPVPEISMDKSKIELETVCTFLQTDSYWGRSRSREQILRSIELSRCYCLLLEGRMVGFARVLTDYVSIAYLADVFVLGRFRGKGWGSLLLEAICADEEIRGVRSLLFTKDAHGFYERFGFSCDEELRGIVMHRKST